MFGERSSEFGDFRSESTGTDSDNLRPSIHRRAPASPLDGDRQLLKLSLELQAQKVAWNRYESNLADSTVRSRRVVAQVMSGDHTG